MDYILDLLLKQIFGQPFLLLAIVVFIGYIAMKQTVGKAIIGAFKASIGILVMGRCIRTDSVGFIFLIF